MRGGVVQLAGLVVVLVGAAITAVVLLTGVLRQGEPADDGPLPERGTPVTHLAPLPADLDLQAWSGRVAGPTGVPARALTAYGAAERRQRAATPNCRLS